MKPHRLLLPLALLPLPLAAQQDSLPAAAPGPAVERITTASSVSAEAFGNIVSVRELRDGRVLVNDGMRRRLLLMDSALAPVRVVLDSTSAVANTYGTRAGALIPFRGDTVLFVDPASYAIVVLDPEANPVRVRSVWRVEDLPYFSMMSGMAGWPDVDGRGRVVYRIPARAAPPRVPPPAGIPYIPPEPDSAFLVAVDLDTRRRDTLTSVRVPKLVLNVRRTREGGFTIDQVIDPLPLTDDWAVLPDGRVAIVRGLDYRVDYLHPDGTWSSSPKLPFEWRRLDDAAKQKLADSVRVAQEQQASTQWVSSLIRWVNTYARSYPPNFKVPEGFVLPRGLPKDWILPPGVSFPDNYMYACPPGVEPNLNAALAAIAQQAAAAQPAAAPVTRPANAPGTPPAAAAPAAPPCLPAPVSFSSGGVVPQMPQPRQVRVIEWEELPDYRPPIGPGAVRADLDGNLWVRTLPMRPVPGGPVYDVVNPQGELVRRLQLPPNYTLVGFGRGRVVYLSMRDATGMHLARVRLRE